MQIEENITTLIRQRFSCRTYLREPISESKLQKLQQFIDGLPEGPFGGRPEFHLVAAENQDSQVLKDLGTYGFIQGATGFIVGSLSPGEKNLEDYGYLMEQIILFVTSLQLGTCWLGGSFTRSSFARKINAGPDVIIPAVSSSGEMIDPEQARKGVLRRQVKGDQRLAWDKLFFDNNFGTSLSLEAAGAWGTPLEMLRLGPSASNKQPWRVIRRGSQFHVFLQRTRGYRESSLTRFMGIVDIQRLDTGIAMCHFELTARQLGLTGGWTVLEPAIARPDDQTEYCVTWNEYPLR